MWSVVSAVTPSVGVVSVGAGAILAAATVWKVGTAAVDEGRDWFPVLLVKRPNPYDFLRPDSV